MRELGRESERGHREVGETAATLGVDHLITIGEVAEFYCARRANGRFGQDYVLPIHTEAAELLGDLAGPGDLALIKGSRAARTEEVIEQFSIRHSTFVISP